VALAAVAAAAARIATTGNAGNSWGTASVYPGRGGLYTSGDGKSGQTGAIDLSGQLAPQAVGTGTDWNSTGFGGQSYCAVRRAARCGAGGSTATDNSESPAP